MNAVCKVPVSAMSNSFDLHPRRVGLALEMTVSGEGRHETVHGVGLRRIGGDDARVPLAGGQARIDTARHEQTLSGLERQYRFAMPVLVLQELQRACISAQGPDARLSARHDDRVVKH